MTDKILDLICPECGEPLEFQPNNEKLIICGNPNGCDRYVVWEFKEHD